MIYIETGSTDVCYDFALEYYFTLEKRLSDTVFLFWRTTPTLMVGKYQNVLEEVDKPYADAHGIRIVRRMSGGGTIYTDLGGWQFSFIQHRETGEIEFSQYIMPVLEALEEMGVHAAFNGRNDLTIQGRKFSGQRPVPAGRLHRPSRLAAVRYGPAADGGRNDRGPLQDRLQGDPVRSGPGHQHCRASAGSHGSGDVQKMHRGAYIGRRAPFIR